VLPHAAAGKPIYGAVALMVTGILLRPPAYCCR